jgi:adenylosuccinate lyase
MITVLSEKVFPNLRVFPENMMENIMKTGGAVFSQNVLGWLLSKGYSRDEAYKVVQQSAKMVLEKNMRG